MESRKIEMFMMQHHDKFDTADKLRIRTELEKMPDDRTLNLSMVEFKSPTTALLFSIFLGGFGVGAFYVKKTVYGVILVTLNILFVLMPIEYLGAAAAVVGAMEEDGNGILLGGVFVTILRVIYVIALLTLYILGIVKARKWAYEFYLKKLNEVIRGY